MLTESRNQLSQALKLAPLHISENPHYAEAEERVRSINAGIEELQRVTARPVAYRFVLKRKSVEDGKQ